MWNSECGVSWLASWRERPPRATPHSALRIRLPHPEQLKPPLVSLHDALAVRRVLGPRQRRIARDDPGGRAPRRLEQVQVAREIGVPQRDPARLPRPGELPHPALLQVQLRDREAVGRVTKRLEARRRFGRIGEQDAVARRRAPAHPAAQLVQLRQAEPLGVLDQHHRRVGTSMPTSITVVATRTCTSLSRNARMTTSRSSGFTRPWTSPTRNSANTFFRLSAPAVAAFKSARSDTSITG